MLTTRVGHLHAEIDQFSVINVPQGPVLVTSHARLPIVLQRTCSQLIRVCASRSGQGVDDLQQRVVHSMALETEFAAMDQNDWSDPAGLESIPNGIKERLNSVQCGQKTLISFPRTRHTRASVPWDEGEQLMSSVRSREGRHRRECVDLRAAEVRLSNGCLKVLGTAIYEPPPEVLRCCNR